MVTDRCWLAHRQELTPGMNSFLSMVYHRVVASNDDELREKVLPGDRLRLHIVKHNLDGWGYAAAPDCLDAEIKFINDKPHKAIISYPWDEPVNFRSWRGLFDFLIKAHNAGWRNYR